MISDHDRSGWFGASDARFIMGNWNTKTFARFWMEKLGMVENRFMTPATLAGTHFEHRILEHMGIHEMDRQIRCRRLRLRVNLDGEDSWVIHEVKTYSKPEFKIPTNYWQQCQIQMWAAKKQCQIDAYRLEPEDYQNFFTPIEENRLSHHPIKYDKIWMETECIPRLEYLSHCLKRRMNPW